MKASNAHAASASALQNEIWADAITGPKEAPGAAILVVPALNAMIDITTTRSIIVKTHVPPTVLATLIVLTLVCSLLVGSGLRREQTFTLDPAGLRRPGVAGRARRHEVTRRPTSQGWRVCCC